MPLLKGKKNRRRNFRRTEKKLGKGRARKQMIAIVLNNERKRAKKRR
jgi:hypothetical protein